MIPTFKGRLARVRLTSRWSIPNTAPRQGETPFGCSRVLFVDDFDDGRPQAYWAPDKTWFPEIHAWLADKWSIHRQRQCHRQRQREQIK